ncbi:hypothetical protein [Paracoccus spongiarum]|uniref:Glycosyltransferase family 1 protein n=1 Tax=Paracoccus spongiarum TaxID=3064387 RepID=A0ABT9JEV8_9RHOB|nr:hypothetical protein [Paracoccus sp. 2205BS29-5]MDP5308347.1 hypothetical protein [Paracoccus sp. 2205BS29-5]
MTRIDVALPPGTAAGWAPIVGLGHLAARLFGGRVVEYPAAYPGKVRKLWGMRPRGRGREDAGLLALLYGPSDITKLRQSGAFRGDYRFVVGWIIDSFWEDRNVRGIEFQGIDHLFIIREEERAYYRRATGRPVTALNWGADVLGQGTDRADRPVDLLRLGRQPQDWDDDDRTAAAAAEFGLRFAGRPPYHADLAQNLRAIMASYGTAKFLTAHTNLVSAEPNTHPTKEYITARWTDALAAGCSIAGVQPGRDSTYRNLFWPGATLEFDRVDLRHNLAAIAEAVAAWTPEQARQNHRMALRRLDWRHGLRKIADAMSVEAPALDADLAEIARRAAT